MEDYLYDGLIERISKEFELQLKKIEAEYNFDNGDEFEIAICQVLRKILPTKYGICRGFVVDKQGNKEGDDIIIYDQEKFPTLRFFDDSNAFAQKNQIPVDAVYAYIEAKNTLDEKTFEKAFNQVVKVKKLCYTRTPVLMDVSFIGNHIFDNEYSKQDGWNPIIKNPVYGMILSRYCKNLRGENATSSEESKDFIFSMLNNKLGGIIEKEKHFCCDSIIAGNWATAFSGHYIYNEKGEKDELINLTRFFTGLRPIACYQVNDTENKAFGLGIAHLMMALNFIQLGDMPWDMIFNTAKVPDRALREKYEAMLK